MERLTTNQHPRNMKTTQLYYTHRRTGKWARLIVYAVHHGQLDKIGSGKYQPGATAGIHREVEEIATTAGLTVAPSVEVVEIETP
jgi:hypothetical protein